MTDRLENPPVSSRDRAAARDFQKACDEFVSRMLSERTKPNE